jgi:hypothetical protein
MNYASGRHVPFSSFFAPDERSYMSLTSLEVRDLQWRTSRRSAGNGACVEVAAPVNGQIAVRDSKNPGGAWLRYPPQSWQAFIGAVKSEHFFD